MQYNNHHEGLAKCERERERERGERERETERDRHRQIDRQAHRQR